MKRKAKLINIEKNPQLAVREAVSCYNAKEVFIYPTDTIYGFGCDRFSESALEKINIIKQRQETNPVSVIFELRDDKKEIFKSKTAAFRIPNHKFCLSLLSALKAPLVSTSVNIKDERPLNDHLTIIERFSRYVGTIFYTNFEENREPSSLIDLSGETPQIIRQGSIKFVDLFGKLL
ncbi:MAG: Sua5/YciO/YrdC/YwlC family protein [Ignavibacteriaceae bacterium]